MYHYYVSLCHSYMYYVISMHPPCASMVRTTCTRGTYTTTPFSVGIHTVSVRGLLVWRGQVLVSWYGVATHESLTLHTPTACMVSLTLPHAVLYYMMYTVPCPLRRDECTCSMCVVLVVLVVYHYFVCIVCPTS